MEGSQVRIAGYGTAFEAETVRGLLEEEGIPSWVADAHFDTSTPLGNEPGRIGLFVDRSDAGRAEAVIRRRAEETLEGGDAVDEAADNRCVACNAAFPEYLERCPACGLSYS